MVNVNGGIGKGRDKAWSLPTATPCCPLPIAFTSVLSEVNRSCADALVISCDCYPDIFHPIVEQLTIFYISGLAL